MVIILYIISTALEITQCAFLFFHFSTIKGAGDGVFLKKDAPKNTIVAFFNGIHITLDDTLRNEDMKKSVHKMWNDWDSDAMVYIPKNSININTYNASFGHKINHNSDFNVDAGMDFLIYGRNCYI